MDAKDTKTHHLHMDRRKMTRQVIVYVKYGIRLNQKKYGIRIAAVTDLECPSKSMVEISYNKLNECVI